ncbi:MAG: nucleotidyltransferase family protein [Oceanipulchritudo sp.]
MGHFMGAAGRCARAKERQIAKFRNWIDGNIDIRNFEFVTVDTLKSKIRQACHAQGVRRLDLFGSRARSDGLEGNDFDFVATFGDCSPGDYAKRYFGLLHELEDTLGAPVDLLTPDSIHRRSLRERIEKDSLCLYES